MVDQPADLPILTLTSILHVKLGKYELLILEIYYCHREGVEGVLHLTSLYNAHSLFTTLIIQKYKEIPTFS